MRPVWGKAGPELLPKLSNYPCGFDSRSGRSQSSLGWRVEVFNNQFFINYNSLYLIHSKRYIRLGWCYFLSCSINLGCLLIRLQSQVLRVTYHYLQSRSDSCSSRCRKYRHRSLIANLCYYSINPIIQRAKNIKIFMLSFSGSTPLGLITQPAMTSRFERAGGQKLY